MTTLSDDQIDNIDRFAKTLQQASVSIRIDESSSKIIAAGEHQQHVLNKVFNGAHAAPAFIQQLLLHIRGATVAPQDTQPTQGSQYV